MSPRRPRRPPARSAPARLSPTSASALSDAEGGSHVGQHELDAGFAVELVLFERIRHVNRRAVLAEVIVPLGGAPGDGAKDAAVLLERHLEVALLELTRTVDDLHAARRKHGPGVARAEGRERRDA